MNAVSGSVASTLNALKCEAGDPRLPEASPLKRLSAEEIKNSIEDLIAPHLSNNQLNSIMQRLQPLIDAVPDDNEENEEGMDLAIQTVTVKHVEQQILISELVANELVQNTQAMNSLVGSNCYQNTADNNCKINFLNQFGLRVLGRPLDQDDRTHYLNVMDQHADSYRNVIAALLSSPGFIYHEEFGDNDLAVESEDRVVAMGPYERAAKLSYLYLRSLPDSELLQAAADGSIMTPQGVDAQVSRLLNSQKVRTRLTESFANQWLHLDQTKEARDDIAEVRTRLQDLAPGIAPAERRQNMIQEVYDYFDYLIWEQQASYTDLMASDLVFPRSQDLANTYGTDLWDGTYNIDSLVRAPAGERAGLLTKAQFLFTGTGSTRPIMRGVSIYEDFLCGNLTLPPDNSDPEGVVITDDMTDQEYVRTITEVPGTACVSCHQKIINPIGFTLDNFDSMGRFRQQERVFQPEGSGNEGQVLVTKPVDAQNTIELTGLIEGDFNGGVELAHELARNAMAKACFASKLWNFSQKQNLRLRDDGCAVKSIYETIEFNQGSVLDALREIPLQPEFFRRTIQ